LEFDVLDPSVFRCSALLSSWLVFAIGGDALAACPTPYDTDDCVVATGAVTVCTVVIETSGARTWQCDMNQTPSPATVGALVVAVESYSGATDYEAWGTYNGEDFCCDQAYQSGGVELSYVRILGTPYPDTLRFADGALTYALRRHSAGSQTLQGQIYGQAGADTIFGSYYGSSDYYADLYLGGGTEADNISGNGGDDYLYGNAGADTLNGGAGDDDLVGWDDGSGSGGGTDLADTINGGDGDDEIWGEAGADTLTGGANFDTIYGGTGADIISAGTGDDVVYGESGDDEIQGGPDIDDIDGGSGGDVICGGWGADNLDDGDIFGVPSVDDLYGGNDGAVDTIQSGSTSTRWGHVGGTDVCTGTCASASLASTPADCPP
jgi:hypothetical protein